MSKLDELRKLEQAATKGPWKHSNEGERWGNSVWGPVPNAENLGSMCVAKVGHGSFDVHNAKFITAARNSMPALLKVVEAAKDMAIELTPEQRAQWEPYWLEKYDWVVAALRELEGE